MNEWMERLQKGARIDIYSVKFTLTLQAAVIAVAAHKKKLIVQQLGFYEGWDNMPQPVPFPYTLSTWLDLL